MSATAFLLARKGDNWSLHSTGIPVEVRREFKRIVISSERGFDEMRYFDTYGHSKRKRLRRYFDGSETVDTTGDADPQDEAETGDDLAGSDEFEEYTGEEPVTPPRTKLKGKRK